MKKTSSLLMVLIIVLLSNKLTAQFSFGVSPGFNINGAYFGYKMNKVVPYIGFQNLNTGYKLSETGKRFNYDTYQIEDYTYEVSITGGLIIPSLGMRYFFLSQNNINAYANILISKPFSYGTATEDGEPITDFNNQINKANIWAGGLGFGMEYNFSENFSLGGEFGIRYFRGSYTQSDDRTLYDPNTGQLVTYEQKITGNATFSPTYTKISLNYYLSKKE